MVDEAIQSSADEECGVGGVGVSVVVGRAHLNTIKERDTRENASPTHSLGDQNRTDGGKWYRRDSVKHRRPQATCCTKPYSCALNVERHLNGVNERAGNVNRIVRLTLLSILQDEMHINITTLVKRTCMTRATSPTVATVLPTTGELKDVGRPRHSAAPSSATFIAR